MSTKKMFNQNILEILFILSYNLDWQVKHMKKTFIIFLILILVLASACSNQNCDKDKVQKNDTQNETSIIDSYDFLSEVLTDRYDDYVELNEEYKDVQVSYKVTNADTGEIIDINDIDDIKIIEIYSPYCDTCKNEAKFISKNFNDMSNVTFLLVSKEKDTNGVQIMRDSGYELPIYYFSDEFPNEAYKLYELGRPGYIVVDRSNKIMFLTYGELRNDTCLKIFSPIKELLPQDLTDGDIENVSTICTSCE